jgi:hypothetical protein
MADSDESDVLGPPPENYDFRVEVPEDVGTEPEAVRAWLRNLAENLNEADRIVVKEDHHAVPGDGSGEWVNVTLTLYGGGSCPSKMPGDDYAQA